MFELGCGRKAANLTEAHIEYGNNRSSARTLGYATQDQIAKAFLGLDWHELHGNTWFRVRDSHGNLTIRKESDGFLATWEGGKLTRVCAVNNKDEALELVQTYVRYDTVGKYAWSVKD